MEFFKKHYEKVILLGLFVLFIVLMLQVLSIIDSTKSISPKDLNLPKRQPDHVEEKADDPKFNLTNMWQQSKSNWYAPGVLDYRSSKSDYYSDLVNAFAIAACPYCAEDHKKNAKDDLNSGEFLRLIPYFYFNGKQGQNQKCPFCGHELLKPATVKSIRTAVKTDKDIDGDGISNDDEKRYGLNENDENDALYDLDGDGFSNYYEIMVAKTNPRDPNSHPPLWYRLRIATIKQIVLPIKFMALNDNGKKDKKEWVLQFNTPRPGRIDRSEFAQLGESIRIENRFYKIVDIQKTQEQLEEKNDSAVARNLGNQEKKIRVIDRSKVILEEEIDPSEDTRIKKGSKLVMVCNETVFSPDKRPVLEDVGIPGGKMTYTVKVGGTFKLASTQTGVRIRPVTYRVVDVDTEKMNVTLEEINGKNAEPIIITAEGKIAPDSRVIERKETQVMPDDPAMNMLDR